MDRNDTRPNQPADSTSLPPDLHEAAMALSPAQRAQLADDLLGSLEELDDEPEGESKKEVEAAWAEEIRRRVEAYDRGELETISLEEFQARMEPYLNGLREQMR